MSVNVQLKDKLQRISGESITSSKILSALGYTPASNTALTNHINDTVKHITDAERIAWNNKAEKSELFSKDYNDLINKPIENTDDGVLYITDEAGRIVARIDEEGLHTIGVTVNGTDVALETDLNNYYTKTEVDSKVGSTFSGDYNDLRNAPIVNDESGILYIADEQGRVIARIDEDGITTTHLTVNGITLDGQELSELLDEKANSTEVEEALSFKADRTELFSKDYNELINRPIDNDDSGVLYVTDESGNIIMRVDENGLETTKVTAQDVFVDVDGQNVSVETLIDNKIVDNSLEAGNYIEIDSDKKINVVVTKGSETQSPDTTNPATARYVDEKIADLVNGAPEALDTLKELGDALNAHEDAYDALLEVVGNKADKTELPTVSAGDNINVEHTGVDYKVGLKNDVSVNKLTANEVETGYITEQANTFAITDKNSNKAFEIDSTGATNIAALNVKNEEGTLVDIKELIDDRTQIKIEGLKADEVSLSPAQTIEKISETDGIISVATQNIAIPHTQITDWDTELDKKQNNIEDGEYLNTPEKTVAYIKQENGKVEATYQKISITKDQITDFKDTVTTVTQGDNIVVNDSGSNGNHNYTVSLNDNIDVTTVKADSIEVPNIIQEDGVLQIIDDSGAKAFEVDDDGTTSVAKLMVKNEQGELTDILELIDKKDEESLGEVTLQQQTLTQAQTLKSIKQDNGKVTVETQNIQIAQSQVTGLTDALEGKMPKLSEPYSSAGGTGKTLTKLEQTKDGAVTGTFSDISIAQSQVNGLTTDLGSKAEKTELPTVSAGNNIAVTHSGVDYEVALEDSVVVNTLEATQSLQAPEFIQDGDTFTISNESGTKAFEVDSDGTTSVAKLMVQTESGLEDILDIVSGETDASLSDLKLDQVDIGANETLKYIKQDNGKVAVDKQSILITQDQVVDLDKSLDEKMPKLTTPYSSAGGVSKTLTKLEQTVDGAVKGTYDDIAIEISAVNGLQDALDAKLPSEDSVVTEVEEGDNIVVSDSVPGKNHIYTISLADEITISKLTADEIDVPQILKDGEDLQVTDPEGNIITTIDDNGITTTALHLKNGETTTNILDLIGDQIPELPYADGAFFLYTAGGETPTMSWNTATNSIVENGEQPVSSGAVYNAIKDFAFYSDVLLPPEDEDANGKYYLLGNFAGTNTTGICNEIYISNHELFAPDINVKTIWAAESSTGSSWSKGTSGQVLMSNGSRTYWGTVEVPEGVEYTAGNGINIVNNTISAYSLYKEGSVFEGTQIYSTLELEVDRPHFYTNNPGSGVVSEDLAFVSDIPSIVTLSQSQYDALTTKDSSTLYFITE